VGVKPKSPVNSIMKLKIHAFRLNQTFYFFMKKCQTYVNKTIFAQQVRNSLRNNHLHFLLVPISFTCRTKLFSRSDFSTSQLTDEL